MNNYDGRTLLSLKLSGMLDDKPLNSIPVTDARLSLERATSALVASRSEERAKWLAGREAAARLREAIAKAFDECRRARATLIARDVGVGETLAPGMFGRTARAVIARAIFLIECGIAASVGLPALAAARDELVEATATATASRERREEAHAARLAAEEMWDALHASLRGAVELALGARGLRGQKLLDAVWVYFPPHANKKSQGGPAAGEGEKKAETTAADKKPAA